MLSTEAKAEQATAPEGLLLRNVSKSFGRNRVLTDISLAVPKGTTTCIVGPSGSGKSTLLRCINLLEVPDEGDIFVGGVQVNAADTDLNLLRSRVGMVFQNFNLFPHMNVLRNVTLGLEKVKGYPPAKAAALAEEQLEAVGLSAFKDRRPGQLSGGQQQRVAIARALVMEPELMLFDEATSALDPELVKGVLEIMRDLAQSGMTMAVVTHELRFAREAAQNVVFLDEGHLIEEGPPEALFEAPRSDRLKQFLSQMF